MEFFEPLVILCYEIPLMSKECFNKVKNFCRSTKCLDNEAMLRCRVPRDEFLFILSLLKSLMSRYLDSIETGWSESLKGVSKELHFLKNDLRFSFGKMFVLLEKRKLLNQNLWDKHPSLIDQRTEIYLIDIVNIYTEYFVLTFLDIVYYLYWCKAYETVLGKSRKKLGVVLFLLFYCWCECKF